LESIKGELLFIDQNQEKVGFSDLLQILFQKLLLRDFDQMDKDNC
jgi:hypothetical protein